MKISVLRTSLAVTLTLATAGVASAQTAVTLPDQTETTTLTATVSEQAQVTVPLGVDFAVVNTSAMTNATAASVTVTNIALATATKQLQISVSANAVAFTPARVGATTWASSDVTWDAATFSNSGLGIAGALAGDNSYQLVATCAADVAECSTTDLAFHLAANPAVKSAGDHTLVITWKFASIGA